MSMEETNDLPLEGETADLPMSLLADGVADHYGRGNEQSPAGRNDDKLHPFVGRGG